MNGRKQKNRKVVGVDFGPAHLEGLFVRIAKLENGGFRTQQWDESRGWIDSELTYGDFFEAIPISREEMRELGMPDE